MSPDAAIGHFQGNPLGSSCLRLILLLFCAGLVSATIGKEEGFTPKERAHWAFQPLQRPVIPSHSSEAFHHPIDAFISGRLKGKNLKLSLPADRGTLLRRAYLDLMGLPPAPEEVDAFMNDDSPQAFERVIDRLLSSPGYGERWARHWLDLARYAESEGFKNDETRPNAWRYRDYVIKAFNEDKPYDRFISEQIAGDELWPNDPDALVATGFNRHYPDESNARNLMQRRQEILNDITDTVGAVFTGLTYGCARCHDHKFDPIRQKDYYRLQAFFANSAAADRLVLAPAAWVERYRQRLEMWEEKTRLIREQIAALEETTRKEIIQDYVEKYPEEIQVALAKSETKRTPFECQMVAKAKLYLDPGSPQYIATSKTVAGRLKAEPRAEWDELQRQLQEFAPLYPGELPLAAGVTDLSRHSPPTYVLRRGSWEAPRDEVQPGFLSMLDPNSAQVYSPAHRATTGRRTALAKILTDGSNPLTARVMVNRIWQSHFGRGIVATPSDFGFKGDRPTHPDLLDWLATEFIRHGWSVKLMHRLIMTSSTYRQAATYRAEAANADPDNQLLWRFSRHRLEGEAIRDACLAVSGVLNPKMGGPSVFPELPHGLRTRGGWLVSEDPGETERRSIYVFVRRNTRYPLFEVFDMPDTHESCARRNITVSPLQALALLNSELSLEWARNFAGRVLAAAGENGDEQVAAAYRLAFSRFPTVAERTAVRKFFDRQREIIVRRVTAGEELALPPTLLGEVDKVHAAALVDFCHMLLNANEFVYVN